MKQSALDTLFSCPKCRGPFRAVETIFSCDNCGFASTVSNEITDFRCEETGLSTDPTYASARARLTGAASREAWHAALHKIIGEQGEQATLFTEINQEGRCAWKFLLTLPKGATVLDLSCDLGTAAKNLAPSVMRIVVMDWLPQRLQIARQRFALFNPDDDLTVVLGDEGASLPFQDAQFDLAILPSAFGWQAGASNRDKSKIGQIAVLQDVHRVLKDSGQIFITADNRYSHEIFTHKAAGSGVAGTLKTLDAQVRENSAERSQTRSHRGYVELLDKFGFTDIESFGFLPNRRQPEEIVPYRGFSAAWKVQRPTSTKQRIKRSAGFIPSFGLIGRKPGGNPSPSLLDRLLAKIEEDVDGQHLATNHTINGFRITGKDKGILSVGYGPKQVIVKLPMSDGAVTGEAKNYRFLKDVRPKMGDPSLLPEALARGVIQGVPYFAEEQKAGVGLRDQLLQTQRGTLIDSVSNVLLGLNPDTTSGGKRPMIGEVYDAVVARPAEAVLASVDDHVMVEETKAWFRSKLYGAELNLGIVHGTFTPVNMVTQNNQISGLFDWEDAEEVGVPLIDAFYYLDSCQRLFFGSRSLKQSLQQLCHGDWSCQHEWQMLEDHYHHLGADQKDHEGFVYLYWLHHVESQLRFDLSYDARQLQTKIHDIARELLVERG